MGTKWERVKDERVTQACRLVLTTRARPPVRSEVGLPRHAHIAKGAMYAPPEAGFGCASAPNRWERSRNVAWNQRFHKLRSYRGLMGPARTRCAAQRRRPEKGLGGAYMAVFAMCASRGRVAEARTHRKRRVVCATRPRGQGRRETTKI